MPGDAFGASLAISGTTIAGGAAGRTVGANTGQGAVGVFVASSPLVPVNTSPPTISGTPAIGTTLVEGHAGWANGTTSFAYQWADCDASGRGCTAIAGAMGSSYKVAPSDAGHTLRVQETATNASGTGSPATSNASAAVPVPVPVLVPGAPPTISGSPQQGQTLTEGHGTWTNGPTSFLYQWEDCDASGGNCTAIGGANAQIYTLAQGDAGHTIRVQETAINAGGRSQPATSAATGAVTPTSPLGELLLIIGVLFILLSLLL